MSDIWIYSLGLALIVDPTTYLSRLQDASGYSTESEAMAIKIGYIALIIFSIGGVSLYTWWEPFLYCFIWMFAVAYLRAKIFHSPFTYIAVGSLICIHFLSK
jgi:hypothetical protein